MPEIEIHTTADINKLEGCTIKVAKPLENEKYPGLLMVVTHPLTEKEVYVKFIAMANISMIAQQGNIVTLTAEPILGVKTLEDKEVQGYEELSGQ